MIEILLTRVLGIKPTARVRFKGLFSQLQRLYSTGVEALPSIPQAQAPSSGFLFTVRKPPKVDPDNAA
jgi:hypothetical protein